MDRSPAIEWLYLTGRGENIARADFPAAWRGHGDLAQSVDGLMEHFRGRVLYTLLDEQRPDTFTAAAFLTLPGEGAIDAVLTHPGARRIVHPDEVRVFGELIARRSIAAHREVVTEGTEPAEGEGAAYAWLSRAPDTASGDFEKNLRSAVAGLHPTPVRCAIDWPVDGPFPSTVYDVDAVVELYGDIDDVEAQGERLRGLPVVDREASWVVGGSVFLNWDPVVDIS